MIDGSCTSSTHCPVHRHFTNRYVASAIDRQLVSSQSDRQNAHHTCAGKYLTGDQQQREATALFKYQLSSSAEHEHLLHAADKAEELMSDSGLSQVIQWSLCWMELFVSPSLCVSPSQKPKIYSHACSLIISLNLKPNTNHCHMWCDVWD